MSEVKNNYFDRYEETKYPYHRDGTYPPKYCNFVWVFGSNLRGAHGAGAARIANKTYGFPYGKSKGFHASDFGDCYAIPTKGKRMLVLSLQEIEYHIEDFKNFAMMNDDLLFWITRIGCGLAGYPDSVIAPLFDDSPTNCNFAIAWKPYLE